MSEKKSTNSFSNFNFLSILKKSFPIALIGLALLAINWGLHKRLSPSEAFDTFIYPYEQNFQDIEIHRWFSQEGVGKWTLSEEKLHQTDPEVVEAQIYVSHWLVEEQPYRISVKIDLSDGGQSAGISFNAQYPEIYTRHHRAEVRADNRNFELSTGLVTEDDGYKEQIRIPLNSLEQPFRLDVLVGDEIYAVQINGQTLIENRPLVYHDGLVGLVASGGSVTFDDLTLTEIEDSIFDVNLSEVETLPREIAEPVVGDMIYTSNFAGGSASNGWVPFSGDWDIVDGYLTQKDPTGYDFGIGYEPSIFQSFILQATFTHQEDIGAGVLFNMPTPYQTNGAHMVRYAESGKGIFWGYYDASGNFTGQGHAILPTREGTPHTIKVLSGDDVYTIFVDNQQIANNVPLVRNSGYIGLITSRSAAAFGMIDITGLLNDLWVSGENSKISPGTNPALTNGSKPEFELDTLPSSSSVNLLGDMHIINGDWTQEGLAIQQNNTDHSDYVLSTGVFAGVYTLESTITLPDATEFDDVGGGLVFHMATQDDHANSHLVRLSGNGKGVFWGYFNEDKIFVGQSSASFAESAPTNTYKVKIAVRNNAYDLYINDELITKSIPLVRQEGFIGLLAYRGPVSFEDIKLKIGGVQ
ncbi:MAG: hypothetical protein GY755_16295 [Chloroflexi bacterium]|nr:hypothetical protein [Chloroflexota bacterium]